ncbi:MAG: metallophosphoesterase, partial [Phycisphaeraceae bacterium]|nr:metallophosphoesterase [Phycisphaeraceae bacterium]
LSKRLLGQVNLWLNRRHRFRPEGLSALIEQIDRLKPDRLIGTGDLTTTALPKEFEQVRSKLGPLLDRYEGFVIPGNHDRYTLTAAWSDRFGRCLGNHTSRSWPCCLDLGDGLGLIGLDPTRPTLWTASGRLGNNQLRALKGMLDDKGFRRWVVCGHYPIGTPAGHRPETWQHRLRDADRLIEVLGGAGRPVLYCHGHEHAPWCYRHPIACNVTVVNAGAPLMIEPPTWPRGQGFWMIDTDAAGVDNETVPWRLRHHAEDEQGTWRQREIRIPSEAGFEAPLQ